MLVAGIRPVFGALFIWVGTAKEHLWCAHHGAPWGPREHSCRGIIEGFTEKEAGKWTRRLPCRAWRDLAQGLTPAQHMQGSRGPKAPGKLRTKESCAWLGRAWGLEVPVSTGAWSAHTVLDTGSESDQVVQGDGQL